MKVRSRLGASAAARRGHRCLRLDNADRRGCRLHARRLPAKPNAKKVKRIGDGIIVGFAGSTADAFTLLERLERKLEEHPGEREALGGGGPRAATQRDFDACAGQLTRACVDLAKAWRTDKYLRRLEVPATARLLGAKARSIHVAPRGLIAGRAARGGQERVFRAHGKRRRAGAKRWHHG